MESVVGTPAVGPSISGSRILSKGLTVLTLPIEKILEFLDSRKLNREWRSLLLIQEAQSILLPLRAQPD